MFMETNTKKMYDGTFRIYDSECNSVIASFVLRGYPTASSLEKIRYNMEILNGYVTLELRMYEIEIPT